MLLVHLLRLLEARTCREKIRDLAKIPQAIFECQYVVIISDFIINSITVNHLLPNLWEGLGLGCSCAVISGDSNQEFTDISETMKILFKMQNHNQIGFFYLLKWGYTLLLYSNITCSFSRERHKQSSCHGF